MHYFYFNDCTPKCNNNKLLIICLTNTLKEYQLLKGRHDCLINGIITSKLPSEIFLNDYYSLADCIQSLDHNSKRYAYSVFNKYPIEKYILDEHEEEEQYLTNEYVVELDNSNYDALYLYIVNTKDGFLFSLATLQGLQTNIIQFLDSNGGEYTLFNLFGEATNTLFIGQKIEDFRNLTLSNFDRLLSLFNPCKYSERFKKSFESNTDLVQKSIIGTIESAIARGGPTKLFADDDLIKDVSHDQWNYKVYELRVKSPVAFRIYFYEATNYCYLALAEKKPSPKIQDEHIKTAKNIIQRLVEGISS